MPAPNSRGVAIREERDSQGLDRQLPIPLTFAFTDIEGSTARWERDRVAMQDAVRRHDAILRNAITQHGGNIFKTMGDAFFGAFAHAADAVAAMVAAQRAISSEDFSGIDGLRVRAAINSGVTDERDGEYRGVVVDTVARLLAIGHGGQILLTAEAAAQIEPGLPSDMSVRDLGTYRLKDIPAPQRVYQLLAPGVPEDFPPLRSVVSVAGERSVFDAADFHSVSNFSGRDVELALLSEALGHDGAIAILHGLGGVGKSSIAREFGWRHRAEYSVIWWLNAQTEDGIVEGLLRLGAMFVHGLDQLKDRRAAAQRVVNSILIGFDKPVLLVFDNLEREAHLRMWMPRTGTRALATSRDVMRQSDVSVIPLQAWTTPIAIEFLLRESGRADLNRDDARAITEALGALPLALAHAAAALRNLRMVDPRRYLDHLSEHLRRAPRGAEYPNSVFATFSTAITQAEQHAAGSAAALRFAASFAADAIPDELFRQPVECYPEGLDPPLPSGKALDLRSIVDDELGLDEALGALDRLSLLSYAADSRTYRMHRLVQQAVQDLTAERKSAWSSCAVAVLDAAFPDQADVPTSWPACERLMPHARAALDSLPNEQANLAAGQLAYRCSVYLHRRGEYPSAVEFAKRSLTIREALLGPDHLDVARSLGVLGMVYWQQGRLAEAESLHVRSFAIREQALGPDHPDVAVSLNSLALSYFDRGRYAEAERLHSRALAIREKAVGPNHHDFALSLNNLAVVYEALGRYADAEQLYRRAEGIWEKIHGPEDLQVAFGLNNVASILEQRGRAIEAEPLCLRSVAIREKVLGPNHPELAMSLNILGLVYAAQRRYEESEASHLRALAIREKAFEPDRPDVAQSLNNLAEVYRLEGRYADAESLLARAIPIRENTLGPDHPDVAESLHNLASVYRDWGRQVDAEPLFVRALSIREKVLGSDHPHTHRTREALSELRSQRQ